MTERAAHLVDEVIPFVPVRQWVLTLPYRLRYLLPWDHVLSRAVLAIHARALLDFYRRQAQRQGFPAGRTGIVTALQRFGGGLNLNVHSSVALRTERQSSLTPSVLASVFELVCVRNLYTSRLARPAFIRRKARYANGFSHLDASIRRRHGSCVWVLRYGPSTVRDGAVSN
jgi:hypothetical protein